MSAAPDADRALILTGGHAIKAGYIKENVTAFLKVEEGNVDSFVLPPGQGGRRMYATVARMGNAELDLSAVCRLLSALRSNVAEVRVVNAQWKCNGELNIEWVTGAPGVQSDRDGERQQKRHADGSDGEADRRLVRVRQSTDARDAVHSARSATGPSSSGSATATAGANGTPTTWAQWTAGVVKTLLGAAGSTVRRLGMGESDETAESEMHRASDRLAALEATYTSYLDDRNVPPRERRHCLELMCTLQKLARDSIDARVDTELEDKHTSTCSCLRVSVVGVDSVRIRDLRNLHARACERFPKCTLNVKLKGNNHLRGVIRCYLAVHWCSDHGQSTRTPQLQLPAPGSTVRS